MTHLKGELRLSPADFRCYFKDNWAKFASSLYLPKMRHKEADLLNQIESGIRYIKDFIVDTLDFIFDLAESAVNKKIILYPHNAYKDGYGVNPKNNPYIPPKDNSLGEWSLSPSTSKKIGFILDLNDLDSINKFVEMIPILLGNLLVRPAAFIVRDPDIHGLRNDQCSFAFDMSGSLWPSQMVGDPAGVAGPPPLGMSWTGGSEADYRRSYFYKRWNEILSRHNNLTVYKFDDHSKFYDVVRRILFTNVNDIAFYF